MMRKSCQKFGCHNRAKIESILCEEHQVEFDKIYDKWMKRDRSKSERE
jgi:hypothetical protein